MVKIKTVLLGVLLTTILILPGCTNNGPVSNNTSNYINHIAEIRPNYTEKQNDTSVDRVEVLHFHPTNQCSSCRMVGELAEKTVNTYFKDELDSGKLVFAHINGELPENWELVMKYGATGSSLWIGTYINATFYKEENTAVWYKINNEGEYVGYLKGILEKRLVGELN